jgi:hypothetical protein
MDLLASIEAREEGLRRVTREEFQRIGMDTIMSLPRGWTGDAQDIRVRVPVRPHHYNAWGALILRAVRSGYLQSTGDTTPGRLVSTHAHRNPVWRRA